MRTARLAKSCQLKHSHLLTRSDLEKCHWNIVNFTRAAGAQPQPPHHILGLQKCLRIIQVLQSSYLRAFSAFRLNSNGLTGIHFSTVTLECKKIFKSSSWEKTGEIRLSSLTTPKLMDLKGSFSAEGSQSISLTRQNTYSCLCWLEGIMQL